MSTPEEKENLRLVFSEIMTNHELKPEDVASNRARKDIFSRGNFHCERCGRTWESRFSGITFNLKRLEIVKRWKMLCKHCGAECYPVFPVDQLKEMFEKAVLIFFCSDKTSTPEEKENLRPVFSEIMTNHELKPEDVATNRARKDIFSRGNFHCERCGRTWESRFSWITFNLNRLEIVKRWKMLCRNCRAECYPIFPVDQLKEMFEKAVLIYLKPNSDHNASNYGARRNFHKPHLPELCEKCGYTIGGFYCWSFFFVRC